MPDPFGTCRQCGGSLQRVPNMPDYLVCGSGHLYHLEVKPPEAPEAPRKGIVRRVGAKKAES